MDPSIVFPNIQIQTWPDIDIAINIHPSIRLKCHDLENSYQSISIIEAMIKLSEIGKLLQISYCGTKSNSCNPKIVRILILYQPLINDSIVVYTTLVDSAIKAFNSFRYAILAAEKKDFSQAVKIISPTAHLANAMAKLSQDMINQSKFLCDESGDALRSATYDESKRGEKKNQIQPEELVIKTLGKIVTILENTRFFWACSKKQWESLANFNNIENTASIAELAPEYKIEFINAIKSTGLHWLGLADINRIGAITMKSAKESADKFMSDLPTKNEALALIKSLTDEMLREVEKESKILEKK